MTHLPQRKSLSTLMQSLCVNHDRAKQQQMQQQKVQPRVKSLIGTPSIAGCHLLQPLEATCPLGFGSLGTWHSESDEDPNSTNQADPPDEITTPVTPCSPDALMPTTLCFVHSPYSFDLPFDVERRSNADRVRSCNVAPTAAIRGTHIADAQAMTRASFSGPTTSGLLFQPLMRDLSRHCSSPALHTAATSSSKLLHPKSPSASTPAPFSRSQPPARRKRRHHCTSAITSSSSSSAVPLPCTHPKPWRRLRAKRGFVFYACRLCQVQWSVPSSRAVLQKASEGGEGGRP
eukprot:GGOE01006559.1.p1 GENE.GGOE01006559.1~~GGOE01006559.1.p1  ORF type:complete len:310 (+),score=17.85 GGOE01006559.1:66-932(+)